MSEDEPSPETSTCSSTATACNPSQPKRRIFQNFLLIWLDTTINKTKEEFQNILGQRQSIGNYVHVFTELEECIALLSKVEDIKTFLVVEKTRSQQIIPLIHDIPQLDTVYIFSDTTSQDQQWTKKWNKIKGIHIDIQAICETLQLNVNQCNQSSIAMSFVPKNEALLPENLDRLEPTFVYTYIFRDILLEMEFDDQSVRDFSDYYRKHNDCRTWGNIDRFERDYHSQSPIWWYSSGNVICSMLNYALRTMEADILIKMGFFLYDLHLEIEKLHRQQLSIYCGKPFTVYRGQGLSKMDFEKLLKTKGGLLSFNSFLSTSKRREISLHFASAALGHADVVGILFTMSIDPQASTTPFADIANVSYFQTGEEEILFSMHTVFRLGAIERIDNHDQLYEAELRLPVDDDAELLALNERIGEQATGHTSWERLGNLLLKTSQFDKAQLLYNVLVDRTSDDSEKALYHHHLGTINDNQGDHQMAIHYYDKVLKIYQKTLPSTHASLATSYNNIGMVYNKMGEYSKALSFCHKALEIRETTLLPNHPWLATSYSNIGKLYDNMGEYSKALSFYEKALEIQEKNLPATHPDLATSYGNIGNVHANMGEYSKALSFFEKVLEMQESTLPSTHPDLATSHNNIGKLYNNMGEYSKALSFYEKALEIQEKNLPATHPDLATSYGNIGNVHANMGEYSKALSFYEKALEIQEKVFPATHPDLATSYGNIGNVHANMGEYSKALSFYEKALEIQEKVFPATHPDQATSYGSIGNVYANMGEYSKALSFYEKALEIQEKVFPATHPDQATSYGSIGNVYANMGEYSKALSFYEKALEIQEKVFPATHPDQATSYGSIGNVYANMGEYSKALSFYEKALEIQEKSLPPTHPYLAISYRDIGNVYDHMGQYPKALSFYKKALEIREKSLLPTHPDLATSYKNTGMVYYHMGDNSEALSYFERARAIREQTLTAGHPDLKDLIELIESVNDKLKVI